MDHGEGRSDDHGGIPICHRFWLLRGSGPGMSALTPACAPEAVGLSSAGLELAWRAYTALGDPDSRGDSTLPGGVMCVARHGQLCFARAWGLRDVASKAAMTTDTVFAVASMTKTVTSLAAGMLFERGLLGLDGRVRQRWRGLALNRHTGPVLGAAAAGATGWPWTSLPAGFNGVR